MDEPWWKAISGPSSLKVLVKDECLSFFNNLETKHRELSTLFKCYSEL